MLQLTLAVDQQSDVLDAGAGLLADGFGIGEGGLEGGFVLAV